MIPDFEYLPDRFVVTQKTEPRQTN